MNCLIIYTIVLQNSSYSPSAFVCSNPWSNISFSTSESSSKPSKAPSIAWLRKTLSLSIFKLSLSIVTLAFSLLLGASVAKI
ncbi:hypothetical protein NIES2101_22210 [Calothrix sp. HK-06]|nr:hypothetical protein NIES2101_22210 [Calothrix sp. HK-06]